MDAADVVRWTRDLCRREVSHLLCCDPVLGPCNLRTVESERRRMGPPEWARFQIAAHVRADVTVAMNELWPVTIGLDWENLQDHEIRELPMSVQFLYVLIIMGPSSGSDNRVQLPPNQLPKSRFGMVSWAAAERILRRNHKVIQAGIDDAIGQMTNLLNGPDDQTVIRRYIPGILCRPGVHEFSVGGNVPAIGSRCFCGRTVYRERVKAG